MLKDDPPNEEDKKQNISNLLKMLIQSGKLRLRPWTIDKIMEVVDNPEVLHPVDDSVACNGRQCINCEGCDSMRANIAHVRSLNEKEEDEDDAEHLDSSDHALEDAFRELEKLSGVIHIQFSRWEVTKMIRDAILDVLDVDIFKLRSTVLKQKEFEMDKGKWDTIKLFMILCSVPEFFSDMSAVQKGDETYSFFNVRPNGQYYLPGKMLFMKEEDGEVKYPTVAQHIECLNRNTARDLKLMQESLTRRVESLARWTAEYT